MLCRDVHFHWLVSTTCTCYLRFSENPTCEFAHSLEKYYYCQQCDVTPSHPLPPTPVISRQMHNLHMDHNGWYLAWGHFRVTTVRRWHLTSLKCRLLGRNPGGGVREHVSSFPFKCTSLATDVECNRSFVHRLWFASLQRLSLRLLDTTVSSISPPFPGSILQGPGWSQGELIAGCWTQVVCGF